MTTTIKFETGASTHAVNDLILFTDNTRELAELRDEIYRTVPHIVLEESLEQLLNAAKRAYYKTFPEHSITHISNMGKMQNTEYCKLYFNDIDNWKLEHGYK